MAGTQRRRRSQPEEEGPQQRRRPETVNQDALRAAARERLGGPFITRAWHADGTEYTDDEYEAAGIEPPSSEQREWLNLPLEERLARIGREANTVEEDSEE
ncbi:MAG: hypothetical protein OXG60_15985 [Chloroflexi bacterium]|nr:hypothetical protein [Chloroflexota bacterium]